MAHLRVSEARRIPRWAWVIAALALIAGALVVVGSWMIEVPRREALARALTGGDPHKGPTLLRRYGCSGCHTIPSLPGADGKVGPALDHLRTRVFIADRLSNTPDHLIQFVFAPRSNVPGTAMPDTGITESEARDVAAYLYAN